MKMAMEEYLKAYKLGKKEYGKRMGRGELPTLEVLDEKLPTKGTFSEVPLGLMQVPMAQIIGTKTQNRSKAFAGNYMPILKSDTEFARKWERLAKSHLEEGIREPIRAYEYLNRFYVEEGNKRVSVMKYFGAVSIPGMVVRIIPKPTEENKWYYEFLDFYEVSQIPYVEFSREGSFLRLQKEVGKEPGERWTEEERLEFHSIYARFATEFQQRNKEELSITVGDAFLALISLYGYKKVEALSTEQLKGLIEKSWEEFEILQEKEDISLKMVPGKEKPSLFSKIFMPSQHTMKAAFLYEKNKENSAWIYGHELGRSYLSGCFHGEVETLAYENISLQEVETKIEEAIQSGCNLIFTTTPAFTNASVKMAISHPSIRILNCSLFTAHRYIRTYYARMYEAKFLMGALAGAMTKENRIAYFADYPIYGEVANINAFALGAKFVNPRAEIFLEWTSRKGLDREEFLRENKADCISGKDMAAPSKTFPFLGVSQKIGETFINLGMPIYHWGRFYEQLVQAIFDGSWKYDDKERGKKAVSYWWGMSSDVIDVVYSGRLPKGTKQMLEFLKTGMKLEVLHPFELASLSPEDIMQMDWLEEGIQGEIPKVCQLDGSYEGLMSQQGLPESWNEDEKRR